MINWKVRIKNPIWWTQIGLSILMPILTYAGLTASDLTTWAALGGLLLCAIKNPYVLFTVLVSVWNAINDPTTAGFADSADALTYKKPKVK